MFGLQPLATGAPRNRRGKESANIPSLKGIVTDYRIIGMLDAEYSNAERAMDVLTTV